MNYTTGDWERATFPDHRLWKTLFDGTRLVNEPVHFSGCARLDAKRSPQEPSMLQQSRHSYRENLRLLILFMLVLPCFAQMPVPGNADPAQAVTPNTSVPAPQVQFGTTGRLSAGDLIELTVYGVPDLSTKARIGNGGDVY